MHDDLLDRDSRQFENSRHEQGTYRPLCPRTREAAAYLFLQLFTQVDLINNLLY
jgi:hypothetical protein